MHMRVSEKQLKEVAEGLCAEIEGGGGNEGQATIVAIYGELGAGKTSFVKEMGKYFNIREPIISPTFVIQKVYQVESTAFTALVHIDAYRLENSEELKSIGWNELIKDSRNLIIIEWPEKISDALPENNWSIGFDFIDENTREIKINKP